MKTVSRLKEQAQERGGEEAAERTDNCGKQEKVWVLNPGEVACIQSLINVWHKLIPAPCYTRSGWLGWLGWLVSDRHTATTADDTQALAFPKNNKL